MAYSKRVRLEENWKGHNALHASAAETLNFQSGTMPVSQGDMGWF
jgi:hypothetical protein